ncbi:MAG: hypothetical protein EOS23_26565 [Mesorhizobium sp.]|nr:MAG: hypothetical protein EOS23_26565 [Mesorhizobium sp.]
MITVKDIERFKDEFVDYHQSWHDIDNIWKTKDGRLEPFARDFIKTALGKGYTQARVAHIMHITRAAVTYNKNAK